MKIEKPIHDFRPRLVECLAGFINPVLRIVPRSEEDFPTGDFVSQHCASGRVPKGHKSVAFSQRIKGQGGISYIRA
jgi:hypothetical protein